MKKQEKICKIKISPYICSPVSEIILNGKLGSIAQLVQSVCLTSRGSGVRLPLLPPKEKALQHKCKAFFFIFTHQS